MQMITNVKFPKSPSARKSHGRHGSPSLPVQAKCNQGGRCVRTWLEKHAGIACVAASEILMLALVVMPHDGQITTTVAGIGIVSASLLGFGVGWIVRDERGRK